MRRITTVLLSLVLLPAPALACDCAGMPVCRRVNVADVIFIGRVIDDGMDGRSSGRPTRNTSFAIEEIFKGLEAGTKEIDVDPSKETDCFVTYEKGARYLIFAGRFEGHPPVSGSCSGSVLLVSSNPELKFLREWAKQPHAAPQVRDVAVTVKWWDGSPVTNAVISCVVDSPDPCVGTESVVKYSNSQGHAVCAIRAGLPGFAELSLSWEDSGSQDIDLDLKVEEIPSGDGPAEITVVMDKKHDQRSTRKAGPVDLSKLLN